MHLMREVFSRWRKSETVVLSFFHALHDLELENVAKKSHQPNVQSSQPKACSFLLK